MTDPTENNLNLLAERHPSGIVHEIIKDLKSLLPCCEAERDPAQQVTLADEIRTLAAVLEHETSEAENGEDFINDGEFHA